MDASQLTRIRRAVAVANGPQPLFGFTETIDYTDAQLGRREVIFQGAIVKPCCTEEEALPLALTLTFEDESTRSVSRLAQFIASRPQWTNFRDMITAYKSFVSDNEETTRAVNGGFFVFGVGRIDFADGSSDDFTEGYASDFIPSGSVRIYGTIEGIFMGGPSLTAVTFVPSTLLNIFQGFVLSGTSVSSLNLNGLSTMEGCYFGEFDEIITGDNPNLTSLDFTPCTAIQYIEIKDNTALTSINVINLSALTELTVDGTAITGLNLTGDLSLNRIVCRNNYLNQTVSDDIAVKLDDYGRTNGTYTINPQKEGDPITVTGGDYDSLTEKGWIIT